MTWQENMLDILTSYFEADPDVSGLLLLGSFSGAKNHPDDWSDIDLLVVVKDGKVGRFFPAVDWLAHFGRLYTYSQSTSHLNCTTRTCYENFNRIDFVFTTESQLEEISKSPGAPFGSGIKIIFSHSNIVSDLATQEYGQQEAPTVSQEQFPALVRDFRFKSMLAVYKVVRNDLLIALHLTQDLIRDCCILGMMLRDRATGTNIHKDGGIGNMFVTQIETAQKPFTSIGLLESIKASNETFEKFAREWSTDHQEYRQPWLDWIEKAEAEIESRK